MDLLKFVALDGEDLEVVSTHLQDAVVKASEVLWRPQQHRLVIALNRFDWEAAAQPGRPEFRRRRAALRFERVRSCKCRGLDPQQKDAVLNLLSVEFTETDAPAGAVTLTFSGAPHCVSTSNASRQSWPILARPGLRPPARPTRTAS
jgi:hypothetical protein